MSKFFLVKLRSGDRGERFEGRQELNFLTSGSRLRRKDDTVKIRSRTEPLRDEKVSGFQRRLISVGSRMTVLDVAGMIQVRISFFGAFSRPDPDQFHIGMTVLHVILVLLFRIWAWVSAKDGSMIWDE